MRVCIARKVGLLRTMPSGGHNILKRNLALVPSSFVAVSSLVQSDNARHFSNSKKKPKKKPQKLELSEVLLHIAMEEESNKLIDKEYEDVKDLLLKSFDIEEEEDSAITRMTRKFNDETIEVVFNCTNEVNIPYDKSADDAENPRMWSGIAYQVIITKKGHPDRIIFHCISMEELTITNVQYFPDGKDCDDHYHGPLFDDLDDQFQDAFLKYLLDRGINGDVNYFVAAHSVQKEQEEYLLWVQSHLGNV